MRLYNLVTYLGYAIAAFAGYLLAKEVWLLGLLLIPVWIGMIVVGSMREHKEVSK